MGTVPSNKQTNKTGTTGPEKQDGVRRYWRQGKKHPSFCTVQPAQMGAIVPFALPSVAAYKQGSKQAKKTERKTGKQKRQTRKNQEIYALQE